MVGGALVEAVAGAGDGDDIGAVEESVEYGAGCGDVAEELAPFFDGAVGGHEGGSVFVSAHDDFQEDFAAAGGEVFEAHVVDDEEVGFEEKALEAGVVGGGSIGGDVADEVEESGLDPVTGGLDRPPQLLVLPSGPCNGWKSCLFLMQNRQRCTSFGTTSTGPLTTRTQQLVPYYS